MGLQTQSKSSSVKQAVQILGGEVGINPRISGDAIEVASCISEVVEAKRTELRRENRQRVAQAFQDFLSGEIENGTDPAVLALVIWMQLLDMADVERAAQRKTPSDPMFV